MMHKESPIRIAYIVNEFNVGGLERYIARMCNHLPPKRFESEIICLRSDGAAHDWLNRSETTVHVMGATSGNNPALIKNLERLLISRSYDIVQSHNWGTLLETYFASRSHRTVMKHIHAERGTVLGSDCSARWKRWTRSLAMRFTLPRISGTVCNAYAIEKKIRSVTKLTKLPIEVIPNGLQVDFGEAELQAMRQELRTDLGLGPEVFVVGFLGRFAEVKNPSMVLDAFYKFVTSIRHIPAEQVKLLMVGDGPLKHPLEQKTKELGVDSMVLFPGERTDSLRWLSAMDILVNSSTSEGMSQAILEAMALGVPLVVTDVGDSRRLIQGDDFGPDCGAWVPSGDSNQLAEQIARFWQASSMRYDFSLNAKQRFADRYSLQQMLNRYEQYYRTVLGLD
jgi:glycosyltransferase involved in cell wall biosynthesis